MTMKEILAWEVCDKDFQHYFQRLLTDDCNNRIPAVLSSGCRQG